MVISMECEHKIEIKIGTNKAISYCTICGDILKIRDIDKVNELVPVAAKKDNDKR